MTRKLLLWVFPHLASLRAVYILGVENGAADLLSRMGPLPGEWRLHLEVVALFWYRSSQTQTDHSASVKTTHCKIWFSLETHGAPLGVDALSREWPTGSLYAFPPFSLIHHVLHRIDCSEVAREVLVTCSPLPDPQPTMAPAGQGRSSVPSGQIWHPKPAVLHLCAWLLCSSTLYS